MSTPMSDSVCIFLGERPPTESPQTGLRDVRVEPCMCFASSVVLQGVVSASVLRVDRSATFRNISSSFRPQGARGGTVDDVSMTSQAWNVTMQRKHLSKFPGHTWKTSVLGQVAYPRSETDLSREGWLTIYLFQGSHYLMTHRVPPYFFCHIRLVARNQPPKSDPTLRFCF